MRVGRMVTMVVTMVACGPASSPDPAAWPPFDEMDTATKKRYMAAVVVPKINEHFAHKPPELTMLPDRVNCKTCHGKDARAVGYKMPNGLHPLVRDDIEPKYIQATDPVAKALGAFMAGPMEHTMAELLGRKPYDPQTHEGFGCFGCHSLKK
ncbi:MAG: hypothetical protein AAGA56_12595 [Myxococcota bacterium]